MPYTYLIGWPDKNAWYYGVRFARGAEPSELMVTYRTSSKYVHQFIEENGLPSHVEIRRIFETAESARLWENKVLRRLRVVIRTDFLNKTDNKSISLEAALKAKRNRNPKTEEHKRKLAAVNKGKKLSEATKQKISTSLLARTPEQKAARAQAVSAKLKGRPTWNKGVPCSAETKAKIGAATSKRVGWKHTEEAKRKMSLAKRKA